MDNIKFREPGMVTLGVSVVMFSCVREDDWHWCRIWKGVDIKL